MAKRKKLKGKDFMIFVGTKAIALATNHTLSLNAETSDTSSKDDGIWSDAEITGMNWEATSESIGAASESDAVDISYEELFDMCMAGEPVDIISGIPKNKTKDGVPDEGWTVPDSVSPTTAYYKGKALITSVKLNAPDGENSSISATFTGVGKLEKVNKAVMAASMAANKTKTA